MVWCIANDRSYSSSLNVFALVAGILLVRGSLKTARWVAMGASFLFAGGALAIVALPFMYYAKRKVSKSRKCERTAHALMPASDTSCGGMKRRRRARVTLIVDQR